MCTLLTATHLDSIYSNTTTGYASFGAIPPLKAMLTPKSAPQHMGSTYSIQMNCTSPAPGNSNGTKPDECLDHINSSDSLCIVLFDGNKFCYKFNGYVSYTDHPKSPSSKYYFNKDKRRVPADPSDVLPPYNLTQNCDFYCKELGEGMTTSQIPAMLIPGVGRVANSIVSYSDLDDMCAECA